MRRCLFGRHSLAELFERLLAGQKAVVRAWQTPGRQHGQRAAANLAPAPPQQNPIVPAVMRLPATPSVADDCHLAASRTLPRQPLGIVLAELASIAGTWDKDDHGREGTPRNRYPAKAHDSAAPPSLLSIRIYAEKESHPALFEIGRFTVTKNANKRGPVFSAVSKWSVNGG